MTLMVKESGGTDFKNAPNGNYLARCYRLTDYGTQTQTFKDKTVKLRKILITWELFP